jgi:fido (protein-threonine AMPylation protein)
MSSLSPEGLKNAHLSLNPEMKKYYGRYREINLRRDGHFIHHDRISYAIDELFHQIYKFKYTSKPELEIFSAKLFCDFLSIHPFLNGNRRIAMALISRFLKDHEADISWQRIGLSEVYYWTRIASRGKINSMIQGFRREIFYSNGNEIDYPGHFLKPLSPD